MVFVKSWHSVPPVWVLVPPARLKTGDDAGTDGRAPDELVEEAVAGYFAGNRSTRKCLMIVTMVLEVNA